MLLQILNIKKNFNFLVFFLFIHLFLNKCLHMQWQNDYQQKKNYEHF